MAFLEAAIASVTGVAETHLALSVETRARLRELLPTFRQVGRSKGIDWYLLAAIAWGESDFVSDAVNPSSGAAGLMQVMPMHFSRFGLSDNGWKDPTLNIEAGAQILIDSGYNSRSLAKTIANYGGFVTTDPKPYFDNVIARGTYLGLADALGAL